MHVYLLLQFSTVAHTGRSFGRPALSHPDILHIRIRRVCRVRPPCRSFADRKSMTLDDCKLMSPAPIPSNLNCPCPQTYAATFPPSSLFSMDDEDDKKTPYNYRILAAVDQSIAAGRDFVVGRGWGPLVNVGNCRIAIQG